MSAKQDSFSVGPSQPDIIGLPTGEGLWIFVRVYELTSEGIRAQAQGWENPCPPFVKAGAKEVVTSDYGNRFLARPNPQSRRKIEVLHGSHVGWQEQ